jgi:hypothetical protein
VDGTGGAAAGFGSNLPQDWHRPTSLFSPKTNQQKGGHWYSGGRPERVRDAGRGADELLVWPDV